MVRNHPIASEHLLDKVAKKYSTCASYVASGFTEDSDRPSRKITFRVFFSRPKKFRFDWTSTYSKSDEKQHYAIWSEGEEAYSCYHFNNYKVEREKNLLYAVACATGLSFGVVHIAYNLLSPSPKCNSKKNFGFRRLNKAKDDLLGSEPCYLISGTDSENLKMAVWLTSDFSILKTSKQIFISAKFSKQADEELSETDPELYEKVKRTNPVYRDRRLTRETQFTKVEFDVEVDKEVYRGSNFPPSR
jgi:hypothetical protein